jgi:hypothetical protein
MEGDTLTIPNPFFLGILGSHEGATPEKIADLVLTVLEVLQKFPERMILPSEGRNNMFLSDWADKHSLPTQVYEADWHRHNRRARIFRDTRIIKEATHFLIFLNKRSEANEKTAIRLAKQGKHVFTVNYADWSIEELTLSEPLLAPPKECASKRGTGTKRESQRHPSKEVPETQRQLTDLWAT